MFAGSGVIGAAATHLQVDPTAQEQGHPCFGEGHRLVGGQLTGQQSGVGQPQAVAGS